MRPFLEVVSLNTPAYTICYPNAGESQWKWYLNNRGTAKLKRIYPVSQTQYKPGHVKMCPMPYANNKGADQPAHLRSLISTFVVRSLDSIISLVSRSKISRFQLVSVAEQAGLNVTHSQTSENTSFAWRGSYNVYGTIDSFIWAISWEKWP